MAVIALTQTTSPLNRNISPVFMDQCRIRSFIAGVAITAGQALYFAATGRVGLSNSTSAGALAVFRGLALDTVGIGQAIDVLEEGYVDGYEIGALAYDASVFLQDTAGAIGTAAGTVSVVIAKVVPVSDKDVATGLPSKLLFVKSGLI